MGSDTEEGGGTVGATSPERGGTAPVLVSAASTGRNASAGTVPGNGLLTPRPMPRRSGTAVSAVLLTHFMSVACAVTSTRTTASSAAPAADSAAGAAGSTGSDREPAGAVVGAVVSTIPCSPCPPWPPAGPRAARADDPVPSTTGCMTGASGAGGGGASGCASCATGAMTTVATAAAPSSSVAISCGCGGTLAGSATARVALWLAVWAAGGALRTGAETRPASAARWLSRPAPALVPPSVLLRTAA